MPAIREICVKLGYKSTSTVHRHMDELLECGLIERTGNSGTKIRLAGNAGIRVPLIGTVAAGMPITAIEDVTDYISFTPSKHYQNSLYALKVRGDSMINVGIYDGDIIIAEKKNTAENGEIVVALVNGTDATVKRFYKEDGHFRLQPENDTMEPIISKDVDILGKVVSLIRYY